jgi:hypothetical protein
MKQARSAGVLAGLHHPHAGNILILSCLSRRGSRRSGVTDLAEVSR